MWKSLCSVPGSLQKTLSFLFVFTSFRYLCLSQVTAYGSYCYTRITSQKSKVCSLLCSWRRSCYCHFEVNLYVPVSQCIVPCFANVCFYISNRCSYYKLVPSILLRFCCASVESLRVFCTIMSWLCCVLAYWVSLPLQLSSLLYFMSVLGVAL